MTEIDSTAHLRGNIKAEAARRGISQRALAEGVGISPTAMHMRLRGVTRITTDDLYRIADVLGVEVSSLIAEDKASA